jgi:hypothetical protein
MTRIEKEVVKLVRDKIGPVAAFKTVMVGQKASQNPVRENPARHHAEDR